MKTLLLPFDELLALFFKCIMVRLVLFQVYLSLACTFLWLFASIFSHERFTLIVIYCCINQNKAFMIYICEIQTDEFALL